MKKGVILIWDTEKAESFCKAFNKGAIKVVRNGARITFETKITIDTYSALLSITRLNEGYKPVFEHDIEIVEEFIYE